ncbi:DUF2846 domain-containing protein [Grimontia marina]|nr:DUF2846 domain-containing protein [Grimontia marina]
MTILYLMHMRKIYTSTIFALTLLTLSGCASKGAKFVAPAFTDEGTSSIYLMRQSSFVGAIICRPVLLDDINVGCLQNGGFLRVELSPGEHTLKMPKVNSTDWFEPAILKGNFESGKTYYAEWTGNLETFIPIPNGALTTVIGSAETTLIEYQESDALPILKSLYDSSN